VLWGVALAAVLALTGLARAQTREPSVRPGDSVDFAFTEPPFGGETVASLAALRGRATLIVYWTPTCSVCTGMAVPDALARAEADGDVLAVVCAGYDVASRLGMLAFAADEGWIRPGVPALWTREIPCDLGFWKQGMDPHGDHVRLPAVLLLDETGRVVLAGGYSDLRNGGRLADTVADLVARLRGERVDAPSEVRKLWAKRSEGRAGAAIDRLDALAGDERRDEALAHFVGYWELQAERVRADLAAGAVPEARARAAAIEGALTGSQRMAALVAAVTEAVVLRRARAGSGPRAARAAQEARGTRAVRHAARAVAAARGGARGHALGDRRGAPGGGGRRRPRRRVPPLSNGGRGRNWRARSRPLPPGSRRRVRQVHGTETRARGGSGNRSRTATDCTPLRLRWLQADGQGDRTRSV
jgi:hypothetical protein